MFAHLAVLVLLSVTGVYSTPLPANIGPRSATHISSSGGYPSLNNWGHHASLSGFDSFYGSGHFDCSSVSQTVIKEDHVVCRPVEVEVIQQKLVVIQELAKRIISEQICEVETQTIVLEQFHSSVGSFHGDISRDNGHRLGYDSRIAGLYSGIFNDDGSISTHDLGFNGSDLGSLVVPSGTNWGDNSAQSIESARQAAEAANKASTSAPTVVDGENTVLPSTAAVSSADGEVRSIPPADPSAIIVAASSSSAASAVEPSAPSVAAPSTAGDCHLAQRAS